ncbi:MAG: Uma2 family endonuclease [Pseudonocardiaceae bacterium]
MCAQPLDELFAGHAGPWTEQEWAALPESMGRVELLDGALVVSPFPAASHQRLVRNLAHALEAAAPAGFEVFEGLNIRVGRDRIMIPDIVVLNEPGLDAVIFEPDRVALVVVVTSPSTAWADRLVKPDAYACAGIPYFLRVDLDRAGRELGATHYSLSTNGFVESARATGGRLTLNHPFHADLDLAALAAATRYPGH